MTALEMSYGSDWLSDDEEQQESKNYGGSLVLPEKSEVYNGKEI